MVGAGGVSKFDGDMDDYTEHVLSEMEAAAASADGKIRLQAVEGSSRTEASSNMSSSNMASSNMEKYDSRLSRARRAQGQYMLYMCPICVVCVSGCGCG